MNRDPRRRAPGQAPAKIETVATASAIIDFLAESDGTVGVQKVADALKMTKSRASRHLANLESLGLIERVAGSRGYQLGWRVMRWGQIAAYNLDLTKVLEEPLQRLNETTNKTILLCAPAGGEAIVTKCLSSETAIRIEVKIGLVLSLPHSPSACVCYAFLPREQRQEMLSHLTTREKDFRVENEAEFNSQIAKIQSTYYSWDKNKYNVGYGAIAAPVFNQHEGLAGIITLVLPSEELSNSPPKELLQHLIHTAEECSHILQSNIKFPKL